MSNPAVVMNDPVTGMCAIHQVPSPSGAPMPSPSPLPFRAPLLQALAATVQIGGQPAAVQGSMGTNTPPHVGLHASDPFLAPPVQIGQVVVGSSTVQIEGRAAAYTGCQVAMCGNVPAQVVGSATTVLIGG